MAAAGGGEGGFGRREGERGMKLPEGEVCLVLTGCGADRLRSEACTPAASPRINGVSVKIHSGTQKTVSILIYLFMLYLELSLLLWKSYRHK